MKPILNANAITRALWAAPQRARTAFTSVVGAFSARGESTDAKFGLGSQAARFVARTAVTVAKTTAVAGRVAVLGSTSRFKLGGTALAARELFYGNATTIKRITSQAAPRFGARGSSSGASTANLLPALGSLAFYTNSGADDYARLTSLPPSFGTGEFTFEFRCKLDETLPVGTAGGTSTTNWSSADPTRYGNSSWWYPGNFLLDGHNNSTIAQGTFSVQVIGGGRLRWDFGDNSGAIPSGGLWAVQPVPASSSPSLLDGKWHHVALVRRWSGASSATLEMWIDGALVATETTNVRTNMQTFWASWAGYGGGIQDGWLLGAEKFSAGGGAYWDDYKGRLSYLRFYNRAKTSAELANDWALNSYANETGLVGLFQVGALSANRTYDTIRPAAFIEATPRANPAWVSETPLALVMPQITFTRGTQGSVNLATGARTGAVSPAAGAYVAGFNPTSHVIQRDPASTALPAGVSLSTAGVMAYDGTGTGSLTTSNIRIQVVNSNDADWAARAQAPGVVYANNFDVTTRAALIGTAHSTVYDTWNGQNQWEIETTIKRSGRAALRSNLFAAKGPNETQAVYRASFAGLGPTNPSLILRQFYFQVSMYFDATFARFEYGGTQPKLFDLFHPTLPTFDWGSVVINRSFYGFLHSYRFIPNVGTRTFMLRWPGIAGNYTWHSFLNNTGLPTPTNVNQLQAKHGYTQYDVSSNDPDIQWDPARVPVNGWMTFEVYIDIPNDIVKIWIAPTGSAPILAMGSMDAALPTSAQIDPAIYGGFHLLTRTENATQAAPVDTFTVYDEVIVSTEPIRFPGGFDIPTPGTQVPAGFPWTGSQETTD